MRPDIDPQSLARLHLIGRVKWQHDNGAIIEPADYNGFRARTPSGQVRMFLSLHPGDDSVDWIDITTRADKFIISEKT